MEKIIKKEFIKLIFELASPLNVGSGKNEETDKDILTNALGVPYIPGSSIAGVCIDALGDIDKKKYYFGDVEIANRANMKTDASESRILFYDANLIDDDFTISHRDCVALDEFKTATDGSKFDMEVLEPGVRFVTYLEQNYIYEDDDSICRQIADKWLNSSIHIGSKTMRGYGEIANVKAYTRVFDMFNRDEVMSFVEFDMYSDKTEWDDYCAETNRQDMLEIGLRQRGGISVRRYTTDVIDDVKTAPDSEHLTIARGMGEKEIPVIPGTTWAGAFRHRLEQLAPGEDWKEVFGSVDREKTKSRIRFSETQIADTKDNAVVLSRNAIDRFTGGTTDGALFTEKTYYYGNTTLKIYLNGKLSKKQVAALAASISDLSYGYLAIGGLTSIGRGLFEVTQIGQQKIDNLDEVYESAKNAIIQLGWEG